MVISFTKIENPRKIVVLRLKEYEVSLNYRLQWNFQTGLASRREVNIRNEDLEVINIKLIAIGLCEISPNQSHKKKFGETSRLQ